MAIQESDDPNASKDFEHTGWEMVSNGYERHFAQPRHALPAAHAQSKV